MEESKVHDQGGSKGRPLFLRGLPLISCFSWCLFMSKGIPPETESDPVNLLLSSETQSPQSPVSLVSYWFATIQDNEIYLNVLFDVVSS